MTYAKRLIALLTIDDENNTLLEEEMEAKGQLLISASKLQLWRKVPIPSCMDFFDDLTKQYFGQYKEVN